MKILEVCPYSAGICGVWARVREEAIGLKDKGHEVVVFSSNSVKGNNEIASREDEFKGIRIKRFNFKKLGGESFMQWKFEKEDLDYSPDIIIAHNYRHLHTTKALRVAEKLRSEGKKCKVFLVTHAPFVEGNITRSFFAKLIVNSYDLFIGKSVLNRFDKILAISKWEIPIMEKMGVDKNKIVYIPNGIPEEFFSQKSQKEENKILFLGRIAPKKKLETLISAIKYIKDKKVKIEIVGPPEEPYFSFIKETIKKENVGDRVIISDPIYKTEDKIKKLDSCKIYVLPSRVEGMPQSLIEAMARGKIVIGSDSIAIRDLIKNKKNGYLFEFDNPKDLAEKINIALEKNNKKIKDNAVKSVKDFNWKVVINKIEETIK